MATPLILTYSFRLLGKQKESDDMRSFPMLVGRESKGARKRLVDCAFRILMCLQVANFLGTDHHEFHFTVQEGIDAVQVCVQAFVSSIFSIKFNCIPCHGSFLF